MTPRDPAPGRRRLALIAALLALPFGLAAGLWAGGWRPPQAAPHGELLAGADRPPLWLALDTLQKIPAHAALVAPAEAPPRWTLAVIVPAGCDAACAAALHLARQVQVSLNKEMGRLRRALLGPQLVDDATLAALRARWPDLHVARLPAADWPPLAGATTAPQLLLIDPRGQLVLRYAPAPDPRALRRDLERLLRHSWLG